jgi:hypothetical protein
MIEMKILGTAKVNYNDNYICEITQDELNCIFNYDKNFKSQSLEIGTQIDLRQGYQFKRGLEDLFKHFMESHEKFIKANEILYNYAQGMVKND